VDEVCAMTDKPKKIMILTADAGFGHRSAANAVSMALERKYGSAVEVSIVNPLDNDRAPLFLRDSQADYDKWVKAVPELYQLGYAASDNLVPSALMERSLGLLLYEVMREIIAVSKPDVVLVTYPMYQAPLALLFRSSKKYRVPFYTVVTDLATVHRLWFNPRVDGCLVPNQIVADLAMSNRIPAEKITITGIPVHPNISAETRDKVQIRKDLGWTPDMTTILAVGSKRVERLVDALNVVNHFGIPLQVVVVAGKNEDLYRELTQFNWHIPAHIYDFVENMPPMMKAADLIICKAGGLIVTESLACGLPMILIEVIPGQETGNAEYVTTYEAGDMAESPVEMLETLHHLLQNDGQLLKKRADNARQLGRDQSAFSVADILWNAAQKNSQHTKKLKRTGFNIISGEK